MRISDGTAVTAHLEKRVSTHYPTGGGDGGGGGSGSDSDSKATMGRKRRLNVLWAFITWDVFPHSWHLRVLALSVLSFSLWP